MHLVWQKFPRWHKLPAGWKVPFNESLKNRKKGLFSPQKTPLINHSIDAVSTHQTSFLEFRSNIWPHFMLNKFSSQFHTFIRWDLFLSLFFLAYFSGLVERYHFIYSYMLLWTWAWSNSKVNKFSYAPMFKSLEAKIMPTIMHNPQQLYQFCVNETSLSSFMTSYSPDLISFTLFLEASQIQLVQNATTKLLTVLNRGRHITPLLASSY